MHNTVKRRFITFKLSVYLVLNYSLVWPHKQEKTNHKISTEFIITRANHFHARNKKRAKYGHTGSQVIKTVNKTNFALSANILYRMFYRR